MHKNFLKSYYNFQNIYDKNFDNFGIRKIFYVLQKLRQDKYRDSILLETKKHLKSRVKQINPATKNENLQISLQEQQDPDTIVQTPTTDKNRHDSETAKMNSTISNDGKMLLSHKTNTISLGETTNNYENHLKQTNSKKFLPSTNQN